MNASGSVLAENARVHAVGAPAGAEFATDISRLIWDTKYRFRTAGEVHESEV